MPHPDLLVRLVPCALALLAVGSGCAKSEPAPQEAATSAPAQTSASSGGEAQGCAGHADMHAVCPMAVAGTTASAEDVEGGAALVLTTTGDEAELQRRARAFADMQAKHAGHAGHGQGCDPASCEMHGKGGEGSGHGPGAGHGPDAAPGHGPGHGHHHHGGGCCVPAMPGTTATVEDTDSGARIVYRPADAAQLDALREHVRQKADKLMHCPMRTQAEPPPAS